MKIEEKTTQVLDPKKRRINIFIISILIAAIVGTIVVNYDWLKAYYAYVFKYEHFHKQDNVFVKRVPGNEHTLTGILVCRLIKPLSEEEIDTMTTNKEEKTKLKLNLKKNFVGNYVITTNEYISEFAQSTPVGNYVDHVILKTKDDQNNWVWENFAIVQPVKKALEDNDNYHPKTVLPSGYTYADSKYYVFPEGICKKQ
ncbi:hypothetical protein MUY27_03035 [Mucilaginibacter sp. RS28]|uniref:Uncharacterized protein n=1 Tax=Mucilaginibacter straminoryzae TaxID=2932774 RepID=A0A9X2B7S5_9SPHI|nr:hypothetical protein [Mucilaginibacter straminoryzae]MCJ8208666.1 hypothetical protein [Mucilaginibacter straminoryzae]